MATTWTDLVNSTESAKPPDAVLKEAMQFLTDVIQLGLVVLPK